MLELLIAVIFGFQLDPNLAPYSYERACVVSEQRSHDGLAYSIPYGMYDFVGENIALDFGDSPDKDVKILQAWINSPTHFFWLRYDFDYFSVGRCGDAVVLLMVK